MGSVLKIDIVADGSRAAAVMESTAGRVGRIGKSLAVGAGVAAAGVALAAGKIAVDAVKSASEVEQAYGATESVFGKYAAGVKKAAEGAASSVGLAKSEYANLANVLGAQLKNMGTSADQLGPKTDALIKQGADLAATFGGTTADAVSAVSSLLKGERDPIERYGVSIKAADVSARLAAKGQDKLTGAALASAQAQATLELLTKQTSSAQGAFGRESDTAAGQQQRLTAQWENAKASLGQGLLPIVTKVATFLTTNVLPAVQNVASWLAARLGPALNQVGAFITTKVVPAALSFWTWFQARILPTLRTTATSITSQLVPVLSTVASFITTKVVPAAKAFVEWFAQHIVPAVRSIVTPVVAGLGTAFGKVQKAVQDNKPQLETIGRVLKSLGEFIADKVAPVVGKVLGGAFSVLGTAISGAIGFISDLVTGIQDAVAWAGRLKDKLDGFKGGVADKLGKLNPFGFAATGAAATTATTTGLSLVAPLTGASTLASSPSSSTSSSRDLPGLYLDARPVQVHVQVDVHGAVDRVATARELRRMLADLELWEGKTA